MKETIEDYFLNSAHLADFPSQRDYVAIYRNFRDFMNREIHPEVKTMTTRLDETIYLNDHSSNHISMVIEKVSALLADNYSELSMYEIFFLLIAIWMCAKLWLESKNDKAVPTISIIECSHNVCICKTHDFITYNSIVTFYKKDGNFEKLIGFGLVETINSGGKTAQIRIVPGDMRNKNQVSASEISDFVSYINDNKNNIIVRPTITSDIVPYIYKILNQEVSNE